MKSAKSNLNVKLLRRIKRHILAQPKRFLMSHSIIKANSQKEWRGNIQWAPEASKIRPPCGTAACIAGWAVLLTKGSAEVDSVRYEAAMALGVEVEERWTDHTLFYAPRWPKPFAAQYESATKPAQRAKIAAARIEWLIKTGE